MKITPAIFLFCLALLPLEARAQQWAVYQPEGIGYSVELPGEWKIETEDMNTKAGTVKLYTAGLGAPGRWYASAYCSYPEKFVHAATVTSVLDGAQNGAVENMKGKLRNETRIIISNLPGRHFIVDAPGNLVTVANIFMIGNTLVQAIVVGPQGIELEPDTIRVLQSLKAVRQ
jgi:hypothetical protein